MAFVCRFALRVQLWRLDFRGINDIYADCEYCSRTILGKHYCLEDSCVAKDIPHKHDEKGLIIYKTDVGKKKVPTKHKHDIGGDKQ